jgi:hypothetical protein
MNEQAPIKIKWHRLQIILERLCKRKIDITLTTHSFTSTSPDEVSMSACVYNKKSANFLLNAYEIKSLFMVQNALAHETAHILLKHKVYPGKHDEEFNKKWKEVLTIIKKEYQQKQTRGAV